MQVRFTEARTDKGAAWGLEWLQPDSVVPLPNDDQPAIEPSATPAQLLTHAAAFCDVPLTCHMLSQLRADDAPDGQADGDDSRHAAACIDTAGADLYRTLAQPAPACIEKVLMTVRGQQVWCSRPKTLKQAQQLPNWPRWQMAMQAFVDKSSDGFLPVSSQLTRGYPVSRVKWVYSYGIDAAGDLREKARLVWEHNSRTAPGGPDFQPVTMSNVAKPLHWKAQLHLAMVDGAEKKK